MSRRYKDPPVDEVSLEEFELFAVDRLRGEDCSHTNPFHSLDCVLSATVAAVLSRVAHKSKGAGRVGNHIWFVSWFAYPRWMAAARGCCRCCRWFPHWTFVKTAVSLVFHHLTTCCGRITLRRAVTSSSPTPANRTQHCLHQRSSASKRPKCDGQRKAKSLRRHCALHSRPTSLSR
jgi:hypothetical protein